jgi:ribonucleotide reductase alpha subunit
MKEYATQLRIVYIILRWQKSFLSWFMFSLSNTGTDRGLPIISCFGIDVADSIIDIGQKNLEMMLLAKHGGGVGIGINQIRPAGAL